MALCALGFLGDEVREGAPAEVGLGNHTTWRRALGGGRATAWCGALVAHLRLPFWLPPVFDKIGTPGCFSSIVDLQKYGVLTVFFLAES